MLHSSVKTKDGDENITAYTVDEFEPEYIHFGKMQRNKRVYLYADDFAVLDTETSHDGDAVGWVYQWAVKWQNKYIYGRKPSDFIRFLKKLRVFYGLCDMKKIIFYIHNASYDIQYLKYYLIEYDSKCKIMALDAHTVLICDVDGFRFLCSYKLSNMSLDLFAKTYANIYRKASGEINYNITRYQDDELTAEDWHYMFSDIASQHDAIQGYLSVNGYDKAYKAPYTSTGFVRNDCRHRSEKEKGWRDKFLKGALSREQYNLCRAAFMGGVTIASYQYAGQIVENVGHKDFSSSYPARQMFCYAPEGAPSWYGDIEDMEEFEYLLDTYCCIFILNADEVRIRSGVTAPYIPSSKCLHLEEELKVNGKIVYAQNLSMAMTEIDYNIIKKQYTLKGVSVDKMLIFKRGTTPKWLKDAIMHYYDAKCNLKKEDPRLYMASKAKLNAIYGMSATAIIRPSYKLKEEDGVMILKCDSDMKDENEQQKQLNRFYSSYNSFMPYVLGVYCTAHARAALYDMITAVGYENFLYCDTDSVFYINNEESEKRLAEMNERIRKKAIAAGAYIGDNVLGVATDENPIKRFVALHAKCYAAEEVEGGEVKLKVTIAGIPKKSTKWINGEPVTRTNADELEKIENLRDGFTFRHCGGTRTIYIERLPQIGSINGHITEYASAAIIENIEKVISDTMFTIDKDYSLLSIKCEQKIE